MAQFYSLEEAARILGMSADELKSKAQHREVRAFQDRGTWQFKRTDVDEMARKRGLGSDPDLSLSDLDLEIPPDSDDHPVNLSDYQIRTGDATGSSERDMLLDDLSVPPALTGSSSTIIGMKPTGKQPSDSDVKVVPDGGSRGASDSDVRIAPSGRTGRPSDSDVTLVAEDTSDLPIPPKAKPPVFDPGETTLRPSPMLGSSGEVRAADGGEVDSDSDFELTPSSVIDALQPDSGSDFELTALDASDEFEAAPRSPSDSDVTNALAPPSGVNLGKPTDSGINLMGGGFDLGSDDSIELAPLEDDAPAPRAPAKPSKPTPKMDPGATALPIKDPGATALPIKSPGGAASPARGGGEKDIFEDTDFEVDALETRGEDRTMQLEATSDFDLEDSDSSISEVFAVDEEDVDQNAATAMGSAPAFDDEEDSSEEDAAWDSLADEAASTPSAAVAPAARPVSPMLASSSQAEWGAPWVVALGITTLAMLLAAFVGMDLVSNLNEFRGDGPPSGLVKAVAGLFGGS